MPRFVILKHDTADGTHWDLMIEQEAALRTWALVRPPDRGEPIPARSLADHRIEYLSYEGPISGGRGRVSRFDQGEYTVAEESAGTLVVQLRGERLRGTATLRQSPDDPEQWSLTWTTQER